MAVGLRQVKGQVQPRARDAQLQVGGLCWCLVKVGGSVVSAVLVGVRKVPKLAFPHVKDLLGLSISSQRYPDFASALEPRVLHPQRLVRGPRRAFQAFGCSLSPVPQKDLECIARGTPVVK